MNPQSSTMAQCLQSLAEVAVLLSENKVAVLLPFIKLLAECSEHQEPIC